VRDDRLRLIFACCHPALSTESQVALTPTVTPATPAIEAAGLLAGQNLPGLIVVDDRGRPLTILPVLRCCGWRCRSIARTTRRWPG
jgi:hypothetical protein